MPAVLNEHQQWVDSAGKPLVGGAVYFGERGADPEISPQDIFADREFTVQIANPQILDANGRTTNKVWIRDRYSCSVRDKQGVQVYSELDNGQPESSGVTSVGNVQGASDITGSGTPTVTSYVDKAIYVVGMVAINGTPCTLNIDGLGPKPIVYSDGEQMVAEQWIANQRVELIFNSVLDSFVFEQYKPITQTELAAGTETVPGVVDAAGVNGYVSAYVTQEIADAIAAIDVDVKMAILQDQQPNGTDGGSRVASAWTTRVINTEVTDPDDLVTIGSNQFTLIPGKYHIQARQTFFTGGTLTMRGRLFDVTNTAEVAISESGRKADETSNGELTVEAVVDINANTTYEIQYYASSAEATTGLGIAANLAVGNEVYLTCVIQRIGQETTP